MINSKSFPRVVLEVSCLLLRRFKMWANLYNIESKIKEMIGKSNYSKL